MPIDMPIIGLFAWRYRQRRKASNNPLTFPPPEIVSQGINSIVKYFEEFARQGADTLYELYLNAILRKLPDLSTFERLGFSGGRQI